jgi:hypothetical protein
MLVSTLLQNETFLSTTSAYQVLGQLVNAIIGALGPELKPGSPTMLRCEAVCAEMEVVLLFPLLPLFFLVTAQFLTFLSSFSSVPPAFTKNSFTEPS